MPKNHRSKHPGAGTMALDENGDPVELAYIDHGHEREQPHSHAYRPAKTRKRRAHWKGGKR
jgi:hypothetical protein